MTLIPLFVSLVSVSVCAFSFFFLNFTSVTGYGVLGLGVFLGREPVIITTVAFVPFKEVERLLLRTFHFVLCAGTRQCSRQPRQAPGLLD